MTKVAMKVGMAIDGRPRAIGDKLTVSDSVAKRWAASGIAEIVTQEPSTGGDDISTPDTPQSEKRTSTLPKK